MRKLRRFTHRAKLERRPTVMGVPFRVGSDGKQCWWRERNNILVAPYEAIEEKNVTFCDPFNAKGPGDASQVIHDHGFVYEGEGNALRENLHIVSKCVPADPASKMPPTIQT